MKKLKFVAMMLAGISLLGFNSCLNSDSGDDYVPLTNSEKTTCYLQVQGFHRGKVVYPTELSGSTISKSDTTDCTFYISRELKDTSYVYTVNIENLPIKALAACMSTGEIKTAMENAENINLNGEIDFYSTSPVAWLINPTTPEFTLTYGGATHKIQIPFLINNAYSMGAYGTVTSGSGTSTTSKKQIQMQIIAARIYVDEKETTYMNGNYMQFFFYADAL